MSTPFQERVAARIQAAAAPITAGLDPRPERLPRQLRRGLEGKTGAARRAAAAEAVAAWCEIVLDAVADVAAAVKPQVAFFEALGAPGWAALEATCAAARARDLPVLLDAKRGDIGSTAEAYAAALLDDGGPIGADAITLSPYLGRESLAPFVTRARSGKGLFLLLRTSNPGSDALQLAGDPSAALKVAGWIRGWNAEAAGPSGYGPVGAVVGATVPAEAAALRAALPAAWLLVPGYGAQGGGAEDTRPCFHPAGLGALVNSSRGLTYPRRDEADAYEADPGAVIRAHAAAMAADLGALFR